MRQGRKADNEMIAVGNGAACGEGWESAWSITSWAREMGSLYTSYYQFLVKDCLPREKLCLEGTKPHMAPGNSCWDAFTRALVADRPLLPSCVTLGLSLTLGLSFVNGDDSLSLLTAEKIKVVWACSLGNQCPSHVMPPTSSGGPLIASKLLSLKYPSFSSVIAGR